MAVLVASSHERKRIRRLKRSETVVAVSPPDLPVCRPRWRCRGCRVKYRYFSRDVEETLANPRTH